MACLPPLAAHTAGDSITVDSKDLLAAEHQLLVFSSSRAEDQPDPMDVSDAQEEAAWSLVSMGRGGGVASLATLRSSGSTSAVPEEASLTFLTPKASRYRRVRYGT